jgi:anti-sigma factor RsiW
MICSEARQYIFAFLDNELDRALTLEVQRHIEHCPLCARECEIENVMRRKLVDALRERDEPPAFDEPALLELVRCGASGAGPARPKYSRRWKLGAAGAIAAAVLFAVTLFVARRGGEPGPTALADALAADFDHFVTEGGSLQIVSADAKEVSDWLSARTALAVRVPTLDAGRGTLLGGRKCKINGASAAFAVYRVSGELVSVVALQGSGDVLASMKRIQSDGHTHWVDHRQEHTVVACRRGDLVYAVVSRLPEKALLPLMPPGEN